MKEKQTERNELFLAACANGFSDVVSCMLCSGGIDLNYLNKENHSALWLAVHGGHTAIVKQILQRGRIRHEIIQQSVEEAHKQKFNELVQDIVEYPHTVYAHQKNDTPDLLRLCRDLRGYNFDVLTAAIKIGNITLAENIIDAASIYIDLNADYTPFVSAIEAGCTPLVEKLLAKPEVDVNACGVMEIAPLLTAVKYPEIIKMLLPRKDINIRRKDKRKNTVLITAVRENAFETVKLLIEHGGINVDAVNKDASCFLTDESRKSVIAPFANVASKDRTFGVQPLFGKRLAWGDYKKSGLTALQTAVALGYSDIALYLIEKAKARTDILFPGGVPLLFVAIQNDMPAVVELLLKRMSAEELNAVFPDPLYLGGISALHVAFRARSLKIFRMLLKYPVQVNVTMPLDAELDSDKLLMKSIIGEVYSVHQYEQKVYDFLTALLERKDIDLNIYVNFPFSDRTIAQILQEDEPELWKYHEEISLQ